MSDLETQFEKAFTEISFDDSGKHLLEAEAVTGCVVNGEKVAITLDLPPDDSQRRKIAGLVEERIGRIPGIAEVSVHMADEHRAAPGAPTAGDPHAGHAHAPPTNSQPRAPSAPSGRFTWTITTT